MSETRAVCTQCTWQGLVNITPARPMRLHACQRCGRRTLRYAADMVPIYQAYGPKAGERLLRTE